MSAYPMPSPMFDSPWYQIAPRMAKGLRGDHAVVHAAAVLAETVQGSMGDPPQELLISPTGTSNSLCSR